VHELDKHLPILH